MGELKAQHITLKSVKVAPESVLSNRGKFSKVRTWPGKVLSGCGFHRGGYLRGREVISVHRGRRPPPPLAQKLFPISRLFPYKACNSLCTLTFVTNDDGTDTLSPPLSKCLDPPLFGSVSWKTVAWAWIGNGKRTHAGYHFSGISGNLEMSGN